MYNSLRTCINCKYIRAQYTKRCLVSHIYCLQEISVWLQGILGSIYTSLQAKVYYRTSRFKYWFNTFWSTPWPRLVGLTLLGRNSSPRGVYFASLPSEITWLICPTSIHKSGYKTTTFTTSCVFISFIIKIFILILVSFADYIKK